MSASTTAAPATPSTNILQPFTGQQQATNDNASALLRQSYGKRFFQPIANGSFTPVYGQPTIINVPLNPVGLITKFVVEVQTTVTNPSSGSTLTRGSFGPFSTFSLISYTDPAQNNRIQTTGYHLAMVNARRRRRVPGSSVTTDSPTGFGATLAPIAAPSTIAANATGTVSAVYEIPLSYGRNTLKGAVFAGAVFATQNLQLTFNPNFAQNSADPLGAVYTGASNANPPTYSTTWRVYQEYWDQFPLQLLTALSPDLSTVYELKQTAITSLLANNDNYIRFNNLRQFMSTSLFYDNGGTLNAGTDINYFLLQSANQTIIWKKYIQEFGYETANLLGDNPPAGCYMFDFTEAPIITAAEGNTVLSLNPNLVNSNATIYIGWEDLATSSVLASASSLAGTAGVG